VSITTTLDDAGACAGPEYAELLPAAAAAAITPLAHGKAVVDGTASVAVVAPSVESTNDTHLFTARLPPYVSCKVETLAIEPSVT